MRSTAAFAAILLALPACNSSYIPQARGRVAMILQHGAQAYVRDGQIYQHGFLGSGLVQAVRGNRAAERAAAEYHDRQRDGLLVGLGGLLCSVVAAGLMARDLSRNSFEHEDDGVPTAAWISLGCFAAAMGGLGYVVTAEPYRYDAMNIFNDTAPGWSPGGAPGQLGAVTPRPAPPSLRMRD